MNSKPLVSFIVHSSDDTIGTVRSLRSCLTQSLSAIEVVFVHAGERPNLADDIWTDPRFISIEQPLDASLAQLRRAGVDAATATHVLFLEPGDTADSDLAAVVRSIADESSAELVGFASRDAVRGSSRSAAPTAGPLAGDEVLRNLVPRDTEAMLSPGLMLFQTSALRRAYSATDEGSGPLVDDRANVLLAYAAARCYASTNDVGIVRGVPRPHFGSKIGHLHDALESVSAFRGVEPAIRELIRHSPNPEPLADSYAAGHRTAIVAALRAFASLTRPERDCEQSRLWATVDELEATLAAVALAPAALPVIATHCARVELGARPVRSILLTTNVLTTGGVSGVLLTQAEYLVQAGYRVTIATHRTGSAESLVPAGATHVQIAGAGRRQRAAQWAELCRLYEVDVVIDHRVLYSRDWPDFALAARATGAATVGWIHNFAGRPTYNGNDLHTLLQTHLDALAHLVVLSPLDVAFWKLRGIDHVSYLPNPPSPILLDAAAPRLPKRVPVGRRLELVWWGRLEEHTKKVTELVEVAVALKRIGADFRLRIVGPDWADMTAERLAAFAEKRGVGDLVDVIGPRHGDALLEVIDSSDVFISTSIIEGYLLTIPEAQSRGLPVVMYALPWLLPVQGNDGVISVPQGDANALAAAVTAISSDGSRFSELSRASTAAATAATSYDFAELYSQLVSDNLPSSFSPSPTLDDGRAILDLLVFFAEHSSQPKAQATTRSSRNNRSATHRRRNQPRSLGARIERSLTPAAHGMLNVMPWLRPLARQVKHRLLRHG